MQDWLSKLKDILIINDDEILEHAGKVTRKLADELAHIEFEKFNKRRQILEDSKAFDKLGNEVKQLKNKNKNR